MAAPLLAFPSINLVANVLVQPVLRFSPRRIAVVPSLYVPGLEGERAGSGEILGLEAVEVVLGFWPAGHFGMSLYA